MSLELNYLFFNLVVITLPIVIIEGLIGGNERTSKDAKNSSTKDQVNKSNHISSTSSILNVSNVNVENESSNASKVSNYKNHQTEKNINANLKVDENNELLIEQGSKIDEQQLKTTTLNEIEETIIQKQQTTSLVYAVKLSSSLSKDLILENGLENGLENVLQNGLGNGLQNVEQRKEQSKELVSSFVKIPTIYILAYILFIFIILFLTFYFRSIIRLYNLIYTCLIAFVSFHYLDLFTSKLFGKNSISNRFRVMNLTSFNRIKLSALSRHDLIDFLACQILLAVSLFFAYFWYTNRLNQCIWMLHNLIGYFVCLFVVCSIRLINFRQIFITLSLFTCLDVFFVHFSGYFFNGISITSTIARSFVKRDLNIEELDLSLQLNGSKTNSANTEIYRLSYRIPSIFLIPKLNLVDALALNFNCTSLTSFAIIGFGDLIIAGIISSYCNYFDKLKRTNYIYFLTSIIALIVALILMVLVNDLLKLKGMPVLLFLCPINFLMLFTLAFYRQEFKEFWSLEPFKENYSNVNQGL